MKGRAEHRNKHVPKCGKILTMTDQTEYISTTLFLNQSNTKIYLHSVNRAKIFKRNFVHNAVHYWRTVANLDKIIPLSEMAAERKIIQEIISTKTWILYFNMCAYLAIQYNAILDFFLWSCLDRE